MYGSRKYPYPSQGGLLEIFKQKYESKLEFSDG